MGETDRQGDAGAAGGGPARRPLERVERVFFEMIGLSEGEREGAIQRLCAGDAGLEREVRSLLGSAMRVGTFLERPALGKGVEELQRGDAPDPLVGAELGAFRIERRLASGGMGTVYEAARRDGQFAQRVAIKVVKRGMDSEEILRRFRMERQTLAALDHPNIARLIDGGMTADGRPYVVMEYVDGKPIDAYCDEHRLGVKERLRLFREVCAGMQHAHQNLVIHRDLKPSNILVTAQGAPKLLDFGIAKVISGGTRVMGTAHPATVEQDRRLTPEYASPEQVEGGSLSTASDVYSLGVVLYELLTGTRPYYFNLRTGEEVRRVVCTLTPRPPSEALTVRASRVRTETPSGSGGRARTETPPGTGEGAAVDVPRTRGMTTARLRGLLRGDLDVVVLNALRKEPERRYVSAEQFSADIERYLQGMPVAAQRDTLAYRSSKFIGRHRLAVGLSTAAVALLATATLVLYRQSRMLERQRADLIAANARLDENIKRLSESRRFLRTVISGADASNQGPDAKLGEMLRQASEALRAARPQDPVTLAAAEEEIGRAMMSLGMLEEAAPLLADADKQYASLPADSDMRIDSALNLAELAFYQGKYAEAEKAFRELLQHELASGVNGSKQRISTIMNNLGASVRAGGRAEEAIAIQHDALAATIMAYGKRSLEAAETRNNLASAMFQSGDVAGSVGEFREAFQVRRELLRAGHPLIVRCASNLGLALLRSGKAEEAIPLLEEAATGWEPAFGPEHPGRVAAMTSLAQALLAVHRPEDALTWLERALEWQARKQPGAKGAIAATEGNIGITLGELGRDAEAIRMLERSVPVLRSENAKGAITKSAGEALAVAYDRTNRPEKAREIREGMK